MPSARLHRLVHQRPARRSARGRRGPAGAARVASGVRAMVVPGSSAVQAQAEAEGIGQVFCDAGFEWRQAGCSMCVAMNDDLLGPAHAALPAPTATSKAARGGARHPSDEPRDGRRGRDHRPITDVRHWRAPMLEPSSLTGVAAALAMRTSIPTRSCPSSSSRYRPGRARRGFLWDLRFEATGGRARTSSSTARVSRHARSSSPARTSAAARAGNMRCGACAVRHPGRDRPTFGGIFYSNAMNNRLLAVMLDEEAVQALLANCDRARRHYAWPSMWRP